MFYPVHPMAPQGAKKVVPLTLVPPLEVEYHYCALPRIPFSTDAVFPSRREERVWRSPVLPWRERRRVLLFLHSFLK